MTRNSKLSEDLEAALLKAQEVDQAQKKASDLEEQHRATKALIDKM